ncbi:hypothetical protein J6590_092502 [Homalodisca vitripennis]|nr:hypothetical protein J6590_093572 [Homalodisca vitripennis]KAG8309169.1 hypothetical protein J6590_092502 [Homalodisca vitripennis]
MWIFVPLTISIIATASGYVATVDAQPYWSYQTYNLDAQIGESSACATALLCGVKANFETVGLDIRGKFGNCTSSFVSRVDSLIDWTQQEGETERNHYFKA